MGKYIIGIDLGTTKSALAIYEDGKPKILENLSGKRTTPSVISLKKTGEWVVGDSAKNQAIANPLNTLYGVKRLIGRRFDDPEVAKMKELASYKIVEGPNGDAWVEVGGKAMSPAQISSMVLRELKAAAVKYLGLSEEEAAKPMEAVITVPAYFNDSQRKATRDAGAIAGLDVQRIVNEPTAAALAYGMDKKKSGKVIVYDLGGGTFDVSLLEISVDKETGTTIQVLSTNGDTFLGGENFDERIIDHLVDVLKDMKDEDGNVLGIDLKADNNLQALQRLKDAAEKAKIELSSQEISEINLPFLTQKDGQAVNFEYSLTRKKLEELVQDLIDKTKGPCQKALTDAGLKITDIDEVLLVGAQTRMPKVIETVKNIFGKAPRSDVPAQEIVAMGASVQGAILDGKVDDVLLMDVIPLSIGIRTYGDVMGVMIERNRPIPTQESKTFSTAENNQRDVAIKVYQGERPVASQNKLLGEFTLDGIPPAPKGMPQIEVTFNIDADGVLQVQAKDLKTGREQKITVKANGGLSDAEVESMLKDAEKNADADRLFKALKLASATAEQELQEAQQDEKEEYFLKAPADLQKEFRDTVKELTEAVAKKDPAVIVEKTQKLVDARTKLGEAFYNASEGTSGEAAAEPKAETPAKEEKKTEPKKGTSTPPAP